MKAKRRGSDGRERDHERSPPFPGEIVPREQWTRTRVGLGAHAAGFDWRAVFGRVAPRVLDLGCGNGRFLVASALARPTHDHLGVELVPPALRMAVARAGERGLTNCKFAWGEASAFLRERVPAGSLAEIHLYHPQPYYEASKTDRRQLTPAVLACMHRALEPGGILVFQTDNKAFWTYACAIVPALFEWRVHEGPWPDAPAGRTLREIRARAQGLTIWRAQGRRIDLSPEVAARRAAALPEPDFDANRPRFRRQGVPRS